MKRILFFSVLVCLFLMQGCGKWVVAKYIPINTPSSGCVKNYTLGERKTAFIGQEIIKVEICDYFQKMIISDSPIVAAANYKGNHYNVNHNNMTPIIGMVVYDGKTYYLTQDSSKYWLWGILISDDGSINKSGLYSKYYESLYLSDSTVITPDKVRFSTSCIREKPSSVSFELIFAGKNDVSLNATYKEYSVNDQARPAFFQNLTYQANAKQIRFKNFVIQIHDVTNEQITYTVLEDGLK